jgi:thioredoxin 1
MIAYVTELNTENTKDFTSDGVVLVDVWAPWCGPCKMISPIVDEISSEYQGKVKVGKLEADNNRDLVMEMGIRSIPTLIVYKDGVEVERSTGAVNKQKISEMLENHLN